MKQFRLILILWLCMAMNAKANETTANLLQQGDSCLSRYDVFHATQYYQNYLEANPSHLGARRKLASCYRKVGNYTACISCLDKIPSDSINHEDMRMYYYAYLNQNNNDKVSLWGERIAFLFPYDSEIIASLAVHYNGVNKPDRAEKVAKNYISQCDSTNLYVNKEYAYSLFMQFKYNEAIPLYEKLIAQGFDNFESNFILGLCYEDLPDNEKALKHYQKAVQFKNDNATCLFHLALIEKSFCMDSLSMAHFNQSLEVSLPKDRALRTYKWLADLHFQHSRYADAARDFELCILYDEEDDPLNYYNAAQMFIASKNKLKAKQHLQMFLANANRLEDKKEAAQLISKAKEQLKQ